MLIRYLATIDKWILDTKSLKMPLNLSPFSGELTPCGENDCGNQWSAVV